MTYLACNRQNGSSFKSVWHEARYITVSECCKVAACGKEDMRLTTASVTCYQEGQQCYKQSFLDSLN